ncbi:conserved hypothetical protein [Ricinus communis]|uniref:RNase H type-1 domain-containing protein n=1 Tax=Ricinus communis TaxID=3988 RepID=B9S2R4_RICCO|nr:conserved hypothetical protein [Ricinus communis]
MMEKGVQERRIHGFKIKPDCPVISSILFADDTMVMGNALAEEAQKLKSILFNYCKASGQRVNLQKFEVLYSRNTRLRVKERINNILRFKESEAIKKCLGVPRDWGRSKVQTFNPVGQNRQCSSDLERRTFIPLKEGGFSEGGGSSSSLLYNVDKSVGGQVVTSSPDGRVKSFRPDDVNVHLVADLIDHDAGEWKEDIIRRIFSPVDQNRIRRVAVGSQKLPDEIVWDGSPLGEYSVRRGYRWLLERSTIPSLRSGSDSLDLRIFGDQYGGWMSLLKSTVSCGAVLWRLSLSVKCYTRETKLVVGDDAHMLTQDYWQLSVGVKHCSPVEYPGREGTGDVQKWSRLLVGVLKNLVGSCVDGKVRARYCLSPLVAEAFALRDVVKHAVRMQVDKAQFEADSLVVVECVTNHEKDVPIEIRSIIKEIRRLARNLSDFSFRYVPRCVNRAADWMSKNLSLLLNPA